MANKTPTDDFIATLYGLLVEFQEKTGIYIQKIDVTYLDISSPTALRRKLAITEISLDAR